MLLTPKIILETITRVRRATRNEDILAICDAAERMMADAKACEDNVVSTNVVSTSDTVEKANVVSTSGVQCPECAKRRTKRAELARNRRKRIAEGIRQIQPQPLVMPSKKKPGRPIAHPHKPWEQEGISRRTWLRQRARAQSSGAK
jgi:hypothetical protein